MFHSSNVLLLLCTAYIDNGILTSFAKINPQQVVLCFNFLLVVGSCE